MNILKKIFFKMPLKRRIFLRQFKGILHPIQMLEFNLKLKKEVKQFNSKLKNENILPIKDGVTTWYKSFQRFIMAQPSENEVALEFFRSSIKLLKSSKIKNKDTKVVLLCVVKNDLLKLKNMIEHHRKIGVEQFGILDNGSDDGTIDWLKKQEDIDVFTVDEKYTTNRRESWINRLIAYYGINRWYILVDSDELFIYSGMEERGIDSLIQYCKNNKIFRVRSIMIDMYAKDVFYESNNDSKYLEECKYFDLDSYKNEERDHLDLIIGGPRGRIFNQNAWLTKYPLYYFEKGDIQGKSHFLYPYAKNKNTKCLTALLHYKFLPKDIKKYRKIAYEGNYFNGSLQYKNYIDYIDNNKLSFINEKSQEYVDSSSIYKLKVMDELNI